MELRGQAQPSYSAFEPKITILSPPTDIRGLNEALVVIGAIVFLLAGLFFSRRGRVLPRQGEQISAKEISQVVGRLQASGKNASFAVLIFVPPGATDGEAVNLQYSIEEGVVGFD